MDYTKMTLEGSVSLILLSIAYKIYKMKIRTHSGCCGEKIIIDTSNSGSEERDIEMGN